jgi:uncharacterized protein
MQITSMEITLGIPGCRSLKEKRGRLQPVLHGLQREFGLSVAEVARQDDWDTAIVGCAIVSTSAAHNELVLQKAAAWIESHPKLIEVHQEQIEHR